LLLGRIHLQDVYLKYFRVDALGLKQYLYHSPVAIQTKEPILLLGDLSGIGIALSVPPMIRKVQQMIDYSDYKVWKEVELWGDDESLCDSQEYTPDEVFFIMNELMAKAKDSGLEGCYIKFSSTIDHDDFLGHVQVRACGYRKVNQVEQEEQDEFDYVEGLCKSLTLTPYEVNKFLELKKSGALGKLMGVKTNEGSGI
jgi:hypothetical protein